MSFVPVATTDDDRVLFNLSMGIDGMTCTSCSGTITRHLLASAGVSSVTVVLATDSANVQYDSAVVSAEELCEEVEDIGFGASILSNERAPAEGASTNAEMNTKRIMLVFEEATDNSMSVAGISETNTWADVIHIEALQTILSQLPGVTDVKCTGRAVSAQNISDSNSTSDTGANQSMQSSAAREPMEIEQGTNEDMEAGKAALSSSPSVSRGQYDGKTDSFSKMLKFVTGNFHAGMLFVWSNLTGIDYEESAEGPLCQVNVTINEDEAQGTGARLLLSETQSFLAKRFPASASAGAIPVKVSIVAQGAFLTAQRMQTKQAREVKSLGRALIAATLFTLPLFVMAMLMMDMKNGKPLRMRLSREILPGLSDNDLLMFTLCTPVQIGSGWRFHRKAVTSFKTKEVGMDFLVSSGTFAAYFYSVASIIRGLERGKSFGMHGQYFETSAVLITVVLLGKYLEMYTRGMTASAINTLVKLRARTARVVEAAPKSLWPMPTFAVEGNATSKKPLSNTLNQANAADAERKDESGLEEESRSREHVSNGDVLMDVSMLQKNDLVRLVAGESVPADCRVVHGHAGADESMLTGESVMVGKKAGSLVFGGTTILEGSATALVECYGDDSALGRIVSTVQETQADKPPIQEVADAVAAHFVPAVAVISLLSIVTWSIAIAAGSVPKIWYTDEYESPFLFAFLFGLAVWVSACPCAFGLATPTALMVATGVAAKHGVLVRRGAAMQRAAEVDCVAFDKTGTLTLGKMTVTDFMSFGESGDTTGTVADVGLELIQLLYEAERRSSHPLAAAITVYCKEIIDAASNSTLPLPPPTSAQSAYHLDVVAGQGVRMFVDEAAAEAFKTAEQSAASDSNASKNLLAPLLVVGNPKFLTSHGIDIRHINKDANALRSGGKVAIFVAHNGKLRALLGISDTVHPEANAVLACLRREGIAVYMVTGDEPATAYAIGASVGIPRSHILASAMPQDKEAFIESLQANHKHKAAFVGDGTNDANALARATVGIALGGGTDIAIDTGDILLVQNDLSTLLIALDVCRRCFTRIKMNYFWAVIYNILLVPIAAGVLYPSFQFALEPMLAGAAMAGSSVSIVISSLLLNIYSVPSAYQAAGMFARSHTSTTTNTPMKEGSDSCDCPASEPQIIDESLSTWEVICSSLCSSCGYTVKSASGIGPSVGLVLKKAKNISNRASFDTTVSDLDLGDLGTVEHGSCGCASSNCRCGSDCKCGEIRASQLGITLRKSRYSQAPGSLKL